MPIGHPVIIQDLVPQQKPMKVYLIIEVLVLSRLTGKFPLSEEIAQRITSLPPPDVCQVGSGLHQGKAESNSGLLSPVNGHGCTDMQEDAKIHIQEWYLRTTD